MLLDTLKKFDLPRACDLPTGLMYQLIVAYVLISLPLIQLFPFWIPVLAALTIILKITSLYYRFEVPKWIALAMLIIFGALILMSIKTLGKEYTGIALLFVFASLKILEAREQRDAFLLMLIYLLLIMGALMAQKSPFAFLYLVGCFLYNIYIQLRIVQPQEINISFKHNIWAITKILIMSAPFVAVLFFLFPRFEPLWKVPGPPQNSTGLSEEMAPNSLTSLAQDGGLAFRVAFTDNNIPSSDKLYWRGPVLTQYDGKTWRRSNKEKKPRELKIDARSKVSYRTYHDGSTQTWVVPLDMPGEIAANTTLNQNFEMRSKDLLGKPQAFSLTSYLSYQTNTLSRTDLDDAIKLPDSLYPKTRQLAADIRRQSSSDEDFANRLWQYFRDNTFYYDLEPPVGNSDIDIFLFDNQVGYCEHFSSAFTFMLRSQGVPSRIVTGYQGGDRNPISDELEVKQLHAHAWSEVYIKNKGWVRYDPTAAVAPERINRGSPFGSARNTQSISTGARLENNSAAFRQMSNTLRAMNAFWQNWVLNYDTDKQNSLWKKIGLENLKYMVWILLLIILVPVMLLLWWWYRRWQESHYGDDITRAMRTFFNYTNKHDMPVITSQPLSDWLTHHMSQLGSSGKYAGHVIQEYYKLRYNHLHTDAQNVKTLNKAITCFIEHHRLQHKN